MITREQLKVGETYSEEGYSNRTVLYIGRSTITCSFSPDGVTHEELYSIPFALKRFSLIKKAKKIKLFSALHSTGFVLECNQSYIDKYYPEGVTIISTREVEIEEE